MLPIQSSLRALANTEKAKILSRFFKTGVGQYGEWDVFLGIQVPDTRKLVKQYLREMDLESVDALLQSEYHEERLAAMLTLVEFAKRKIYSNKELGEFYMDHREPINNWDLVDTSSEHIIGPYLSECLTHEERIRFIDECIASPHLWTNRIIMLASFAEIKRWNEKLAFYIASKFMNHKHDLMHKATGWMLREVGKRVSESALCGFLDQYAKKMPRTMLRYAIERLDVEKKERYMSMK